LQLNFQQEYAHLSALRTHKEELVQEIATGQSNLAKLATIAQEHQRQKVKISSELELLEAEVEAAKK
jgi:xylose isomerase